MRCLRMTRSGCGGDCGGGGEGGGDARGGERRISTRGRQLRLGMLKLHCGDASCDCFGVAASEHAGEGKCAYANRRLRAPEVMADPRSGDSWFSEKLVMLPPLPPALLSSVQEVV